MLGGRVVGGPVGGSAMEGGHDGAVEVESAQHTSE